MMNSDTDPIVAIATAPGKGGVGVVRISGPDLEPFIQGLLGPARAAHLRPRVALHADFCDDHGRAIDSGIALWFPAPRSYTGESVLELQGHGGPAVLQMILARCLQAGSGVGARIAHPGEFTQRAFRNGKIDLAQAEAVADLIDAGTAAAARGALRSLQGEFSRAVQALATDLLELRALTEATLDFPEEEIEFLRAADCRRRLAQASDALHALLHRARQGALLREGIHVVLAGSPNVGKSSLLNALAGEEVAIVTEHPGTTRDRIERRIAIDGVVLNVVDTAGLRETTDPVEAIGIARTRGALASADIVLHLVDDRQPEGPDDAASDAAIAAGAAAGVAVLRVRNKIDLTGSPPGLEDGCVRISARSGAGLDVLRREILRIAGWEGEHEAGGETTFLARARHVHALERAVAHLDAARAQADQNYALPELMAEELRLAGDALGEVTGAVTADDVLGEIFGRFCIGK
ncbi:GTPase [Burkholderiales bacterium GJ-E10]|nr:GTPase [Burkholderiales bacterium GJ-E10]